jgi:hypothetical protein
MKKSYFEIEKTARFETRFSLNSSFFSCSWHYTRAIFAVTLFVEAKYKKIQIWHQVLSANMTPRMEVQLVFDKKNIIFSPSCVNTLSNVYVE